MDLVDTVPENKNLLIIGDFNINLEDLVNLQNRVQQLKDSLLDRFPLKGLTQTVRKVKRHLFSSISSLIDHSWLNNMQKFVQTRNIESPSDHDIILTTVKVKGNVNNSKVTVSRGFKYFNEDDLKLDLILQPWCNIYDDNNVNVIACRINEILVSVLDRHTPRKRKVRNRNNKSLTLSKACLDITKQRNKIKREAKKGSDKQKWMEWRRLKNKVNNKIRDERKQHENNNFVITNKDITGKQLWNLVKDRAGWTKSLAPVLLEDGS